MPEWIVIATSAFGVLSFFGGIIIAMGKFAFRHRRAWDRVHYICMMAIIGVTAIIMAFDAGLDFARSHSVETVKIVTLTDSIAAMALLVIAIAAMAIRWLRILDED